MLGRGTKAPETILPSTGRAVNAQEKDGEGRRGLALIGLIQEQTSCVADEHKVLPVTTLGKAQRRLAGAGENRPGRGRTYDQGIMSPLL